MFNTITNEIIIEGECDDDAESLIAYWLGDLFEEPLIKDETFKAEWEAYVTEYEKENNCQPGFAELESFIERYDSTSWIAYEITSYGMACGPVTSTVLLVVNKDVIVEEVEDEDIEYPVNETNE
jgi:hypothetical protein